MASNLSTKELNKKKYLRMSSLATTTTASPLSSSASTSSGDFGEAEDSAPGRGFYMPHGQPCSPPFDLEVPMPPGRVAGRGEKAQQDGHIQQVLWKTTPCTFFEKGICKKGENCSFAHGRTDMRVRPDLTKTVICSSWQRRRMCKAGDNCRFAHGPSDLRGCESDSRRSGLQQEASMMGNAARGHRLAMAGPMMEQRVIPMMVPMNMQEVNQLQMAMVAGNMTGNMRYREASQQTLQKMLELAMPDHYED